MKLQSLAFKLVDDFAGRAHRYLNLAWADSRSVGEETLTDLLYLDFLEAAIPGMRILKVSKRDEPVTGCDLELIYFSTAGRLSRLAFQAKKMDSRFRYRFSHLVRGRQQIEVLEKYCSRNKAEPFYLLYNSVDASTGKAGWNCSSSFFLDSLGATFVSAIRVRWALKTPRARNFAWIHKSVIAKPFRCLFCTSTACSRRGLEYAITEARSRGSMRLVSRPKRKVAAAARPILRAKQGDVSLEQLLGALPMQGVLSSDETQWMRETFWQGGLPHTLIVLDERAFAG